MAEELGESGFEIDGERYAVPTLDTIDLDEERILYIYADVVLTDFLPTHPDWEEDEKRAHLLLQSTKLRNPDFKRALVHIAYRRRHPESENDEINVKIGSVNALEVDLTLLRGSADTEDPPTSSPNELDKTSEISTLEKNGVSGKRSETSSETQDANPDDIGISGSDTSSPESLRIASGS